MNWVKNWINYPKQNINNKYSLLVQIDRIYKHLLNSNEVKEDLNYNIISSDDVIKINQSPKETIRLLLEYLSSESQANSFMLYSSFAPFNRGYKISLNEFISTLQSLAASFIKLTPLSPCELVPLITDSSVSVSFIEYQLRYINSLVKEWFINSDNNTLYLQIKSQAYEEMSNELKTTLLSRTDTEEWRHKINAALSEICSFISDIFEDQDKFKILKQIKYLSI